MKYNQFEEDIIFRIDALEKLIYRIDKKLGCVNLNDEFNISYQKNGARILSCSVSKLSKIIKEGTVMKKDIHYRKAAREFTFSEQALLSIKGKV